MPAGISRCAEISCLRILCPLLKQQTSSIALFCDSEDRLLINPRRAPYSRKKAAVPIAMVVCHPEILVSGLP